LHLAGRVRQLLQRDTARDLAFEPGHEQRLVAAGERGELGLDVGEPALRPEPGEVLAEELAQRVGVVRARVGDQRSARRASTSSALGSHAPPATFARTCSGLVAPAMTEV